MHCALARRRNRCGARLRNRANGSSRRPTRIKHRRHEDVGRYAQLHDGLWNQLPITDVFQAASDDTIARATAHCSDLLHQRQDEIRKFVRSLCYHVVKIRVRGELHPQAVADALDKARRPFLAALDQVIVPLKPILTAELIVQPLPIIQDAVRQWLHDSTHTVATQLVLSLHTLVEMDVVGIIEWPGPRACKLNFFRHTIEQDRVGSRKQPLSDRSRAALWPLKSGNDPALEIVIPLNGTNTM